MTEALEFKNYTYQTGAVYEGTFLGVNRHGHGHWQHPNQEVYEGEYSLNKKHGKGVYIFGGTRKRYYGNWLDGEISGEGCYEFGENKFYCGTYEKDKKHGNGFYMYDDGFLAVQKWEEGKLLEERHATPLEQVECAAMRRRLFTEVRAVAPRVLGPSQTNPEVRSFKFPSGAVYTGQFEGSKKHGQGYWSHPAGESFSGQFEYNKYQGWGVYSVLRSGKKFVGQWEEAKMNGWGVYFFNSEETEYFVGTYCNDKKHGVGMYHFAEDGRNREQKWTHGTLVQEREAEPELEQQYIAATRRLVELVKPYAPQYKSLMFPDLGSD